MAQTNPTILNPATRFATERLRAASRSPSRSPIRKAQFTAHEVDPLLGNLSPDSTLKALSETNAVTTSGRQEQNVLTRSIQQASTTERALGIRAAIAGQKVRQWYTELSRWEWPSSQWDSSRSKGFEQPAGPVDEDYLGSLPARLLDHYEERIEEIKDGLEALEVEDLKEHVLDAHIPSRSRPTSANGEGAPPPLDFVQLSDFTAVITATIVQALPYLARLGTLLQTWDVRLSVIRQIPKLLNDLESAQLKLHDAWCTIDEDDKCTKYTREAYHITKSALESKISSLGSQFDRALDALEGREDSLPEAWIDQMDKLESEFANWVVAADKRVFLNEFGQKNASATSIAMRNDLPPDELVGGEFWKGVSAGDRLGEEQAGISSRGIDQDVQRAEYEKVMITGDQRDDEQDGDQDDLSRQGLLHQDIEAAEVARHEAKASHEDVEAAEVASHEVKAPPPADQTAGDRLDDEQDNEPTLDISRDVQQAEAYPHEASTLLPADSAASEVLDEPNFAPADLGRDLSAQPLQLSKESKSEDASGSFPLNRQLATDTDQMADEPEIESRTAPSPQRFRFPASNDSPTRNTSLLKPGPLHLPYGGHRREISEISVADSMLSDAFSDLSTAEILNASTAEISSPVMVDAPPRRFSSGDLLSLSRNEAFDDRRPKTMHFTGEDAAVLDAAISEPMPRFGLDSFRGAPSSGKQPSSEKPDVDMPTESNEVLDADVRPPILHRASVSSVELISKSRVRSILISRRSSHSSTKSPLDNPGSPSDSGKSPVTDDAGSIAESWHRRMPSQLSQRTDSTVDTKLIDEAQTTFAEPQLQKNLVSTSIDQDVEVTAPELPKRSAKRLSLTLDSALVAVSQARPSTSSTIKSQIPTPTKSIPRTPSSVPSPSPVKKPAVAPPPPPPIKSTDETIEEKIQDILTTLPAKIHFSSSQDHDASKPSPQRTQRGKTPKDSQGMGTGSSDPSTDSSTRSTTPTPSLILSPARPSRNARPSIGGGGADKSEVKVYHLSRSGPREPRDAPPIKLHVRLVGDSGERVMVRVGGGWADLAEYLREYALHHGRSRPSIGDNQFDVQTLPDNRKASDAAALGKGQGSKSYSTPKASSSRPTSALEFYRSTPSSANNARTPRRDSVASALSAGRQTPSVDTPASFVSTNASPLADKKISQPPQGARRHRSSLSSPHVPVSTPSSSGAKYTPLGAAGPVKAPKFTQKPKAATGPKSTASSPVVPKSPILSRPTTASSSRGPTGPEAAGSPTTNDSWVQGVLLKARRSSQNLLSPSTAASPLSGTPVGSRKPSLLPGEATTSPSPDTSVQDEDRKKSRSKSRNRLSNFGIGGGERSESPSGGSGGGIRRVFLRKKSHQ